LLHPDDTVRLLRDFPEAGLAQGKECAVAATIGDEQGNVREVEIRYYAAGAACNLTVPADAVQFVLSKSTQQWTTVFWGLETPPSQFIEACLHCVMDQGFRMMGGLNSVELNYDRGQRWWKWGEPANDPAGAHIATAASRWDGCVAAFSGPQRFHLEFRLRGRGEACILLHERDAAYNEQMSNAAACMSLARVLLSLHQAAKAQFCAFPVADPWLLDEDWKSLLRHPYYPDLFLLPETTELADLPGEFRKARLSGGGAILTTLPVKFAPHDQVPELSERDRQLSSLRKCASLGEKYYDQMYDSRLGPTGLYSNAKDAFIDAISLANKLGLKDHAQALDKRLEHIKAVFRSQFT